MIPTQEKDITRTKKIAKRYLEYLLMAQRKQAFALVLEELDNGLPLQDAYIQIIQPAMYELGRLWQTDEISITTEHYCTAATQLLMAQIFPRGLGAPGKNYSMLGCCLGSELHELGMRMVCDFFEFSGWETYFTGAITPGKELTEAIFSRKPDVVCFSATLASGLPEVRTVIRQVRLEMKDEAPFMIAGGLAFLINPSLCKAVDADATSTNAAEAVAIAEAHMRKIKKNA